MGDATNPVEAMQRIVDWDVLDMLVRALRNYRMDEQGDVYFELDGGYAGDEAADAVERLMRAGGV